MHHEYELEQVNLAVVVNVHLRHEREDFSLRGVTAIGSEYRGQLFGTNVTTFVLKCDMRGEESYLDKPCRTAGTRLSSLT